ncbi:MAG: tRNA 5-methoxyuridine(34)/uridine 5-oxyacetic acid(34) synthase CmoB [Pseudomonadota bacterium]
MRECPPLEVAGLHARLRSSPFASHADALVDALDAQAFAHGDARRWADALAALPDVVTKAMPDQDTITAQFDLPADDTELMNAALGEMRPWRKGPFVFGPTFVDTEWRSDWKWQRVAPALAPLAGRRVLDVGGGNGYFSMRCAGAGASAVLNVDPTLLFYAQFLTAMHFVPLDNVCMLPTTFERLPEMDDFDTVLSMGVLYHRRSPLDHLADLYKRLRPGGQLVLETLVIKGDDQAVFVPQGRYARMRNVFFLPSAHALKVWLGRCGFHHARVVDITATTVEEQRSTQWMPFESLTQCLDTDDPRLTVEGHPAPLRAVIVAER